MTDRVLLSAGRDNVEECIDLAINYGLGIELMAFAFPDVLDGNWKHELDTYRAILRPVPGPITLHGPFMDMASGSPDGQVNALSAGRYRHVLHIASELEAQLVVFHPNFIGSLHNTFYREGWHERNVPYWRSIAEYAADQGVIAALENMWEFEPMIIGDLLTEIDHPNLRACLDVGHAMLFGDTGYKLEDWVSRIEPWLVHVHMNNNNGVLDEHHGFDWENGVLDYSDILPLLRSLDPAPNLVLEMARAEDMRNSLYYFDLGGKERQTLTSEHKAVESAAAEDGQVEGNSDDTAQAKATKSEPVKAGERERETPEPAVIAETDGENHPENSTETTQT